MILLLDLPTELLRLALSHLADIDLRSFLVPRSTCKKFEAVIKDILDVNYADHGLSFHALCTSQFHALLDSSAARPAEHLRCFEDFAPFRTLPWTSNPDIREKWLRREASWRRLPLASAAGTIVRRFQMVSISRDFFDDIDYVGGADVMFLLWTLYDGKGLEHEYQALPGGECYHPRRGVTLGWLYDLIAHQKEHMREGWKLRLETKVKDSVEFAEMSLRMNNGERVISEADIMGMLSADNECALLLAQDGWDSGVELSTSEHIWDATTIDEDYAQMAWF